MGGLSNQSRERRDLVLGDAQIEEGFQRLIGETVKLGKGQQLAHVGWPVLGTEEPPINVVSEWVMEKIEEVSAVLGLLFKGLESMAWELFAELEKREMNSQGRGKRGSDMRCHVPREIKNLSWGLSYGKRDLVAGEGSGRRTRGNTVCRT